MRKTFIYIVATVMLALLGACQNNGHIGWLFGVWRIDSYEADGVKVAGPEVENSTLAFQGTVVEAVTILDDYMSTYELYGSWAEDGNTLTLDFTHHDNNSAQGGGQYKAPAWLGMTSDYPMEMTVSDRRSDSFTLSWTTAQGVVNVYKLHKTW